MGGELNGSPLKTLTVGIGLVELKCNFSIFLVFYVSISSL